jgi:hypothetical protein
VREKLKLRWVWPLGVLTTGLAGVGVFLLRGCWHSKMSWPVRVQDCSYQVCLGCGIKRLFDEQAFRAYGPYSYDLASLVNKKRDHEATLREESGSQAASQERPAS